MKNLMKLVVMIVGLSAFSQAANYVIPAGLNGNAPADADLLGVDVIDSTGTQIYGLAAPVYLHWVAVSSETQSNYATLRDSATLNGTSDIALTITTGANLTSGTTMLTFNPPVIFRNGIAIKLSAATTGRWMFGVRRRLDAKIGVDPSTGTSATD